MIKSMWEQFLTHFLPKNAQMVEIIFTLQRQTTYFSLATL